MLQPGGGIWDALDFVGRPAHPTLDPSVDQAVLCRRWRNKGMRYFQDDRITILSRAAVPAIVDETEIAIGIPLEFVSVPSPWSGREVQFRSGAIGLGDAPLR